MVNKTREYEVYEYAIKTCTLPPELSYTKPIAGVWHSHDLMILVAGVCTLMTLGISLFNIIRHLKNYIKPREQRQIVRILLTPFVFGAFFFFSLWFYTTDIYGEYLVHIAEIYETFALVGIFFLFVSYVCPEHDDYESFFASYERVHRRKKKNETPQGGCYTWFYVLSFGVLQILPSQLATAISQIVYGATECPLSPALVQQKLIIQVVNGVLLAVCVISVVTFTRGAKPQLKPRHATAKLWTFKSIVIIIQIQPIVFTALLEGGYLKPTPHFSVLDWAYGLPAFIVCQEMFIYSVIFLFTFSAKPYVHPKDDAETTPAFYTEYGGPGANGHGTPGRMGFFAAFLDAINVWDVTKRCFKVLTFYELIRHQQKKHKYEKTEHMRGPSEDLELKALSSQMS